VQVLPVRRAISIKIGKAADNLLNNEVAGALPKTHWNNDTNGGNGGAPALSNLMDDTGAVTTAAISWSGMSYNYATLDTQTTPDYKVMKSYCGGMGSSTVTATVTSLPAAFATYDVYVYFGRYEVNASAQTVSFTLGSTTYYMKDSTTSWDGNYVRATSTASASPSEGNYVLFENVTGNSFTITNPGSNMRHGFSGIQIVAR
jgi:hypothetical protein